MKIGVVGATGKAGSLIAKEALDRGHDVTAIVRNASRVEEQKLHVLEKDALQLTVSDIEGFDVIINAFGAPAGQEQLHVEVGRVLIEAVKAATSAVRLIVVGGAGSLFVDEAKTTRLMDTPEFPAQFLPTASNQGENLEELQRSSGLQWTFISPAAFFNPEGKRTGSYQKGKDHFLLNAKGESYISYADYAIAVLDEIENPAHMNERFTVVSESE